MARAIALALAQLFSGPILGVLGACALLSALCFVLLWLGIDFALLHWFGDTWLATTVVGVLGGIATFALAWVTFPLVAGAFVGLFLEHVAALVERRHYPELPAAKGLPFVQGIAVSVRFLVVLLAANALLLVLLLVPPVYAVAWLVVNGWLVGREYVELVAMRRVAPAEADALRRRHRVECFATGVALALLMPLPIVNLVLPVLATAVVVHRYHDWRRADARAHAGGG